MVVDLYKRRDELNAKFEPLTTGRKAVDVKRIVPGTLRTTAEYMAEESTSEYSVYEKRKEPDLTWTARKKAQEPDVTDPELHQSKRPGYPKAQLKVHAVMKGRHFDKLIFAGGDCRPLLKEIRRDLLKGLPWSKRAGRETEYSGCFERRQSSRFSDSGWVRATSGYHHKDFDEVAERARLFCDPDSEVYAREMQAELERRARRRKESGIL